VERYRSALAVSGAFVLVVALVAVGWVLMGPEPLAGAGAAGDVSPSATATLGQTASPTTTASASAAPPRSTPAPKPTTKRPAPAPKPRPTAKPPAAELPPPPPAPKPTPTSGCPTFTGTPAPASEVRSALAQAGGVDYWARPGVSPPMGVSGPVDLPAMSVPSSLMNAVAMAESTWRSNVIACDGGIGTMQIMPGTASFIHDRFNSSYNVNTLSGNTAIGAAYVQWLTVYFGVFYFGESFDLDASAPVGDGGATVVLRDAVIAAYNVGHRGVENERGTADPSDDTLSIPNQWYVDRVNGYIANCPCDDF
jgi:soluble lytic murein transglycosylase-like protein